MKAHEKALGISEDEMVENIVHIVRCGANVISTDYIRPIAEKIIKDVMIDVRDSADNENWNDDDIRLAVGRVLCDKLRITI